MKHDFTIIDDIMDGLPAWMTPRHRLFLQALKDVGFGPSPRAFEKMSAAHRDTHIAWALRRGEKLRLRGTCWEQLRQRFLVLEVAEKLNPAQILPRDSQWSPADLSTLMKWASCQFSSTGRMQAP